MTDPPARIASWHLETALGHGGMGVVWRARHDDGREAALKTVRVAEGLALVALRREIHALSRLEHPGIVRIVDHGVHEGLPWYAMELIEGQTLHDRWLRTVASETVGPVSAAATWWSTSHQERVPERTARGAHWIDVIGPIRDLGRTLAWLHGEGVVHRDLKPQNVLVRLDGRPVLVDFGLQVGTGAWRERVVAEATSAGTLAYMAPEQVRGEGVDGRADLYALGCILYELLTGRPPFAGEPAAVLRAHLHQDPTPPSELVTLPPALDELVLRLLEKAPEDRVGFADEVVEILDGMAGKGDPFGPPARPHLHPPRLTGRRDVVDRVRERWAIAASGQGGILWLTGGPGLGRTRLAMELGRERARRGARLVAAACVENGGTPAAIEALLPDVPNDVRLPPEIARMRVQNALVEAIVRLSEDQPVLLVVDDAQWADDLTLTLLEDAPDRLRSARVLVLATCCTDAPERVRRAIRATDVLSLGPLGPTAIAELARGMLSAPVVDPAWAGVLAEASGGSPLLARELLYAALESGALRRDRGGWAAPGDLGPLPRDAAELVRWRVGRLDDRCRQLLDAAAVLGRHGSATMLARVLGWREDEVFAGISELQRRRLLDEAGTLPGPYRPTLLADLRAAARLHLCAAEAVGDADPATLGWHREQAGDHAGAREAYARALAEARRTGRSSDADRHAAASIRLADPSEEPSLRLDRAESLRAQGRFDEARQEVERAAALGATDPAVRVRLVLARTAEPDGLAPDEILAMLHQALEGCERSDLAWRLHERIGEVHTRGGQPAVAERAYAVALASVPEPTADGVRIRSRLATCARMLGAYGRSVEILREALPLAHQVGPVAVAQISVELGAVLYVMDGTEEAEARYRSAIATYRELGLLPLEATALNNLGATLMTVGRLPEAIACYEESIALRRAAGDVAQLTAPLCNLGATLVELGQLERGIAVLEEAVALAGDDVVMAGRILTQLCRGRRRAGDLHGAADAGDRAIALLASIDDKPWLSWAYGIRGVVALADGRSSMPWLERARALSAEIGDPTYVSELDPFERAEAVFADGRREELLLGEDSASRLHPELRRRMEAIDRALRAGRAGATPDRKGHA